MPQARSWSADAALVDGGPLHEIVDAALVPFLGGQDTGHIARDPMDVDAGAGHLQSSADWRELASGWSVVRLDNEITVMPGKRVQFDDATWSAIDLLGRDRMMDFQELADEAFRDLLAKHGRPTDLKTALRRSAGQTAEVRLLADERKRRKRGGKAPGGRRPE